MDFDKKCQELNIPKAVYMRILQKAIAQSSQDMTELENAGASHDIEKVKAISHRMKGDFGNLRMDEIALVSRQINELAKQGQISDQILTLIRKLKIDLEGLQKAFNA